MQATAGVGGNGVLRTDDSMTVDEQRQRWTEWVLQRPEITAETRGGRALLISYIFPPIGGSAAQRPAKLAKYLPRYGWDVEVLTAGHSRFPWRDDSLLADVPDGCRVHRVSGREPACMARTLAKLVPHAGWSDRIEHGMHWRLSTLLQRFGLDDPQSLWVGPAVRFAVRQHRRGRYDVIVSSGPPHFAHWAGLRIARRTGVPWVADVRDPLVSDFDRSLTTGRKTESMRRLESQIMKHAAMVITTCPSLADEFRRRFADRRPDSIRCITNGFDRDDLLVALDVQPQGRDLFVFVAAGAFYGRREIGRIVTPLQAVLAGHPEWTDRVRLVIAGTLDAQQQREWQQHSPPWLTLAGYLDHPAVVRLAAGAACTIVVVPQCKHGETSIPGKTFELLGLPTHLLALVPTNGDTARIVREAGASTVVAFEDGPEVAAAMERIIADHFAGRLECGRSWAAVDRYDRACAARGFAECLNVVIDGRASLPACAVRTSDIESGATGTADNTMVYAGLGEVSASPTDLLNVSISPQLR
ncbi:MAG TPA: glycosyltransferase [Phycisphaerae bacterium]|nr:glycosyltransferase [Phycisphaerae bacterium]HRR85196.1 glycosyltransferase [Phycisphaerae bacterium]